MRILLTNDDGVHAPGLKALHQELKKKHEVWVVAPLDEKSTCGHSITLHKPLRLQEIEKNVFGVSGTPADSVLVALSELMSRKKPDLVVSGINRGANLGQDVFYSGTVSGAREAVMQGIPGVAVSLVIKFGPRFKIKDAHFDSAAKAASQLVQKLDWGRFPQGVLLNVNVPNLSWPKILGFQVVSQGVRHFSGEVLARTDHRGRKYYWVGGAFKGFDQREGTDCTAVQKNYIAVAPHQLDTTSYEAMSFFELELKGKT